MIEEELRKVTTVDEYNRMFTKSLLEEMESPECDLSEWLSGWLDSWEQDPEDFLKVLTAPNKKLMEDCFIDRRLIKAKHSQETLI